MNVEKPSLILPILFVTRKFITLSAFSVQWMWESLLANLQACSTSKESHWRKTL
jgi:hypothetical protein